MRAVVKSHKDLKGTKVFAFGRSVRNLKNLQEPLLESFIPVMLQSGIAYKKIKVKVTSATLSKRDAYTEKILSYRFLKIMNTTLKTSARLPLK